MYIQHSMLISHYTHGDSRRFMTYGMDFVASISLIEMELRSFIVKFNSDGYRGSNFGSSILCSNDLHLSNFK